MTPGEIHLVMFWSHGDCLHLGVLQLTFESVDALQRTLADTVFHYTSDRKKAAGRALGTFVELITYYTLRAWDLGSHIVIGRYVPEFANPEITHEVEFSLHPIVQRHAVSAESLMLPLTPAKVKKQLPFLQRRRCGKGATVQLLTSDMVKRNACKWVEDEVGLVVAHLDALDVSTASLSVFELLPHPFSIFECKRVGVEEGQRKGPQTIEKAKQGAYVARTVSALQKVRLRNGRFLGVLERTDGTLYTKPYLTLLREVIDGSDPALLSGFVLTIGVASNHGNWFTSGDPNKELRVLAQSYDWLLFLTDTGLAQFIDKLLLNPTPELAPARVAFLASYSGTRGVNQFTKVRIGVEADQALRSYFTQHEAEIETWFNVITPAGGDLKALQSDLRLLAAKSWKEIMRT